MDKIIKQKNILALICTTALLASCTMVEKKKSDAFKADSIKIDSTLLLESTETEEAITICKYYNDIASYISGVTDSLTDIDSSLTKNDEWLKYSKSLHSKWAKLDSTKFQLMRDWRDIELLGLDDSISTVFYPFSGPDVLNALLFFPRAENYILIGLEPVGNLPDLYNQQANDSLKTYFNSIEKSLHAILNFSFFRTHSMAVDLKQKELNGTIHLMMLFLKKMGNNIVDVIPVSIDNTGNLLKYNSFNDLNTDTIYKNKGVEIDFIASDSVTLRKIVYFSVNIDDEHWKKNQEFSAFLESMPNKVNTYLKSASYLMHKNYFSNIKNFILKKSENVLQDDSGIPFSFYKNDSTWNICLYGTYDVIPMFSSQKQADLANAYKDSFYNKKELPFGIGYKYKNGESNLLLAKKRF